MQGEQDLAYRGREYQGQKQDVPNRVQAGRGRKGRGLTALTAAPMLMAITAVPMAEDRFRGSGRRRRHQLMVQIPSLRLQDLRHRLWAHMLRLQLMYLPPQPHGVTGQNPMQWAGPIPTAALTAATG